MTLTPESPLLYTKRRLREFIPPQALDDDALLRYFNQGYQQLCEQANAFYRIATFTDVSDQAEYALPADHFQTLRVYRAGQRLGRINDMTSLVGTDYGYYEYDGYLGVSPTPASAEGTTVMLYSRTPALLSSWNSTLDSEFPEELCYGILHYVRWRTDVSIGGEARIATMNFHKQQFDEAVTTMRRRMRMVNMSRVYTVGTSRDLPRREVA